MYLFKTNTAFPFSAKLPLFFFFFSFIDSVVSRLSTASRILDKTLVYEYVNKMARTAWTGKKCKNLSGELQRQYTDCD